MSDAIKVVFVAGVSAVPVIGAWAWCRAAKAWDELMWEFDRRRAQAKIAPPTDPWAQVIRAYSSPYCAPDQDPLAPEMREIALLETRQPRTPRA